MRLDHIRYIISARDAYIFESQRNARVQPGGVECPPGHVTPKPSWSN